jgi:TPR repeat protein
LAERFAALGPAPDPTPSDTPILAQAVKTVAVSPASVDAAFASPPANTRALDAEEVVMLTKRGEELIAQGDIAAARLMLTRAAEAGDARAALALGATYDADVLRKLGVLGVAGDAAQARAWYAKAAEYGSGEATRRLEQFAQSAR